MQTKCLSIYKDGNGFKLIPYFRIQGMFGTMQTYKNINGLKLIKTEKTYPNGIGMGWLGFWVRLSIR